MTDFKNVDDALADLQGVLPVITKATTGNAGGRPTKYADLADICRELFPLMSKRGLAWTTRPTLLRFPPDVREFVLFYSLRHASSGTSIDGEYPLGTGSPQQLGSAITYARRYCLAAVTGIVADEDDDGRAAEQASKPGRQKPGPRPKDELPRNADGSTSRSRTTDAELAATGQMTDAQLREHNRLARDTQAQDRKADRLEETPDDDPWYADPPQPLPRPRPAQDTAQAIVRHLGRLGYHGPEWRDARLQITAQLAGRTGTIGSTNELTAAEGVRVKRALEGCKDRAALDRLLDHQEATGD